MEITHKIQRKILKNLLFSPRSRFSELNNTKLDNNHFNFHLKHLTKLGLVEKHLEFYRLTPRGLEIAGRLDTVTAQFVRQPKIGVCIFVKNDKGEILLGKRLKDPGIGNYNFFTRKVEFSKSIFETARECLKYETGLRADFEVVGNIRHIDKDYDVFFVCLNALNISGKVTTHTKESENVWVNKASVIKLKPTLSTFKDEFKLFNQNLDFYKEFNAKLPSPYDK